jgi:hypothetical protein
MLQNQWQQQSHDNWYNQAPKEEPKTNYWQQPYQQQQPFNQNAQQYGHYQEYYQNNTAYPPQTYGNLQYNQQYSAQNNVYGAQPPQTEGDGWSSTWGWGDEDNSNIQAPSQNTNVVAESFANDKTWNWSLDEANAKPPPKPRQRRKRDGPGESGALVRPSDGETQQTRDAPVVGGVSDVARIVRRHFANFRKRQESHVVAQLHNQPLADFGTRAPAGESPGECASERGAGRSDRFRKQGDFVPGGTRCEWVECPADE